MHTLFHTQMVNGQEATDIETFTRIEDAKGCFLSILNAYGIGAGRLVVDELAFRDDQLVDYINALNIEAEWAEAHPTPDTFIGKLTNDPKHWVEVGVFTPADMAAYLDAEHAKEMRKDSY